MSTATTSFWWTARWGELVTLSLLQKIKAETGKLPTKMIVTNHESDRTAGVDAAEWQGLQVFTHPDTPRLAAAAGYPAPDTSVASLKTPKSRTKVGSLEVAYPGPGYTSDNLVVYVPSANILYGGDYGPKRGGQNTREYVRCRFGKMGREPASGLKATYPDTKVVVPGHGKGCKHHLAGRDYSRSSKRRLPKKTKRLKIVNIREGAQLGIISACFRFHILQRLRM